MSKTNNFLFIFLKIIAWVIFVGLSIEAGGLIVNFIFSLYNPEFVSRLYQKLDLSALYAFNEWAFFGMYSIILVIAVLKAVLFYIVVLLVSKIDLSKPFNRFVSKQISLISYFTLSIGILSYVGQEVAIDFEYYGFEMDNLKPFWTDSQAFVLMAAVIYIIAVIFKKGIDLQNENELTI